MTQWIAEMRTHFDEHFHLVLPDDIKTLSRIAAVPSPEVRISGSKASQPVTHNPWTLFSQVIAPMDSVKPLDKRRGWTAAQIAEYNKAHGGQAERKNQIWDLTWPDGETYANVVFTGKEAEQFPAARHLTLEEPRVRGLAMRLPRFAPGQPVPVVLIPGIAEEIQGIWSLWQVSITSHDSRVVGQGNGSWTLDQGPETRRRRILPLFLADNGRTYMPTARHVWDQLLTASPQVRSMLNAKVSQAAFAQSQKAAEEHGRTIYEALVQEHRVRIAREREKADYAFVARRKTVERIGLPQVRDYRLNLLAQEQRAFQEQLDQKVHVYPELAPLLITRVEGDSHE